MTYLRRYLILTLLLTCFILLSGCNLLPEKPVTVAAHVWVGYEPLFLASREGWLDSKRVRLIESKSATDSLKALVDGKVDGAALTLDEVLKARANGLPLSVIMVFDISAGADVLLAKSDIKKTGDLKGRRIGFEQGSVGELMLAESLKNAGLDKNDIKPVMLTIDQQLDAWKRNQVDAVVTYEPVATQLQKLGAIKLFDSSQIPSTIVDVLAMRSDVLNRSHARAIRHLIDAHFRGLNQMNQNPQDAAYRMASHLGLSVDKVLPSFRGIVLPDAANNFRMLSGVSPEMLASSKTLSNLMVKNNLLNKDDSLKLLLRPDFLPTEF